MLLLVGAPLLGEHLAHRRQRLSHIERRPCEFFICPRTGACAADFDGDGVAGSIEIVRLNGPFYHNKNRALLVSDGNKELLRMPFQQADDGPPPRLAVRLQTEGGRLLISNQTGEGRGAAFQWNGVRLELVPPTEADRSVFSFIDLYDEDAVVSLNAFERVPGETGGDALPLFSVVKLFFYYLLLLILGAVLLYRKSVQLGGTSPSQLSRGNP